MERSIWSPKTAGLEIECGCQGLHVVPRFLLLGCLENCDAIYWQWKSTGC